MKSLLKFSIIIPTFNPGDKIFYCIRSIEKSLNYFEKKRKIKYEILIVNDGGKKIDFNSLQKIKNLKQIILLKNRGVGYARQYGAKVSKFEKLFFIDSDLVIQKNTLYALHKDYNNLKNVGSIGPIQSLKNLNKNFTSDFVCAKSCYGFEKTKKYIKFSAIRSECCLIDKKFLNLVGGWGYFPNAGGEEFDLGHKIIEKKRYNYITKNTFYSTYWDNLFVRCKNIIQRTSNYLPVFLSSRKFETKGSFATFTQALSAFITLLIIFSLLLLKYNIFESSIDFKKITIFLLVINFLIEFDFLRFVFKFFKIKTFILSLFGIFIINISIICGFILGVFNLLKYVNSFKN